MLHCTHCLPQGWGSGGYCVECRDGYEKERWGCEGQGAGALASLEVAASAMPRRARCVRRGWGS
eukprot:3306610-Alexandrium_andersonii.AAC.1